MRRQRSLLFHGIIVLGEYVAFMYFGGINLLSTKTYYFSDVIILINDVLFH